MLFSQSVDRLVKTTVTAYNASQQPTSVTVGSGTSAAATTTTTYDLAGFVASVTDPDGNTTRYTYNSAGQVLTTTNPLGYTSYNTYDADGNLITAIDFNGLKRTMTYDADGHETGETWYAANGTTVVNQINYTYLCRRQPQNSQKTDFSFPHLALAA